MAKHEFQTEVNQLVQLLIHSLYSNKDMKTGLVQQSLDYILKMKLQKK